MPAKPVVNFMLSQNERKEAAKRGMKLCSSSLVLEMRLGREWVKQGRKSGTSGSLYTRAFCWPRGTICQYAHCVALLTPKSAGVAYALVCGCYWMTSSRNVCGAGKSIAQRPYRFGDPMFISVTNFTTAC